MANELIFIVDDDAPLRLLAKTLLEDQGHAVRDFDNGKSFLENLDEKPSLVFLDVMMPGLDGIETLKKIKELHPEIPVIMLTSVDKVETAVEVIKLGAYDYLLKPIDEPRLFTCIEKAMEQKHLKQKVLHLQKEVERLEGHSDIIGKSQALSEIMSNVQKVAMSNAGVLILGETGTGKELVARAVHRGSHFSAGPFIDINCGAIPETLQESELFGYKKGAFTGANESRSGKLELANGGTLFLDEVGEMSLATQAKLLRFLQERSFERVGDTRKIEVHTRVVAATNRNIASLIKNNLFREDLYYRLAVFPIEVPPLRERKEDIPLLCNHFLNKYESELSKQISSISDEAMQCLQNHSWPGNIRQLENTIYRAMITTSYDSIDIDCLPEDILGDEIKDDEKLVVAEESNDTPTHSITPFHDVVKKTLEQALQKTEGHIPKAAKALSISRSTFYRMLKKYKIN
ncbi:MAG: sigma-54-dependent Fis family transcriptional regulator [Nitrospina sp.]|jgi:DNA-binding NtrC family response regulator|nr:sigma-54-dependent Fis family transcriptional regulator [Nitrospina sp.]MBT6716751.1 sigma-54-dependent Fis family transcriptional regulator [Nitrospina sp.]